MRELKLKSCNISYNNAGSAIITANTGCNLIKYMACIDTIELCNWTKCTKALKGVLLGFMALYPNASITVQNKQGGYSKYFNLADFIERVK